MASPDVDRENQLRTHNKKVERSTRLAIAACRARYGTPEILIYESIDTILDAHPDFNEAKRVLADRREQVIAHILRMGKDMGKLVSQDASFTSREDYSMITDDYAEIKQSAIRYTVEILSQADDWQEGQHALATHPRFGPWIDASGDPIALAQDIIREAEEYLGDSLSY